MSIRTSNVATIFAVFIGILLLFPPNCFSEDDKLSWDEIFRNAGPVDNISPNQVDMPGPKTQVNPVPVKGDPDLADLVSPGVKHIKAPQTGDPDLADLVKDPTPPPAPSWTDPKSPTKVSQPAGPQAGEGISTKISSPPSTYNTAIDPGAAPAPAQLSSPPTKIDASATKVTSPSGPQMGQGSQTRSAGAAPSAPASMGGRPSLQDFAPTIEPSQVQMPGPKPQTGPVPVKGDPELADLVNPGVKHVKAPPSGDPDLAGLVKGPGPPPPSTATMTDAGAVPAPAQLSSSPTKMDMSPTKVTSPSGPQMGQGAQTELAGAQSAAPGSTGGRPSLQDFAPTIDPSQVQMPGPKPQTGPVPVKGDPGLADLVNPGVKHVKAPPSGDPDLAGLVKNPSAPVSSTAPTKIDPGGVTKVTSPAGPQMGAGTATRVSGAPNTGGRPSIQDFAPTIEPSQVNMPGPYGPGERVVPVKGDPALADLAQPGVKHVKAPPGDPDLAGLVKGTQGPGGGPGAGGTPGGTSPTKVTGAGPEMGEGSVTTVKGVRNPEPLTEGKSSFAGQTERPSAGQQAVESVAIGGLVSDAAVREGGRALDTGEGVSVGNIAKDATLVGPAYEIGNNAWEGQKDKWVAGEQSKAEAGVRAVGNAMGELAGAPFKNPAQEHFNAMWDKAEAEGRQPTTEEVLGALGNTVADGVLNMNPMNLVGDAYYEQTTYEARGDLKGQTEYVNQFVDQKTMEGQKNLQRLSAEIDQLIQSPNANDPETRQRLDEALSEYNAEYQNMQNLAATAGQKGSLVDSSRIEKLNQELNYAATPHSMDSYANDILTQQGGEKLPGAEQRNQQATAASTAGESGVPQGGDAAGSKVVSNDKVNALAAQLNDPNLTAGQKDEIRLQLMQELQHLGVAGDQGGKGEGTEQAAVNESTEGQGPTIKKPPVTEPNVKHPGEGDTGEEEPYDPNWFVNQILREQLGDSAPDANTPEGEKIIAALISAGLVNASDMSSDEKLDAVNAHAAALNQIHEQSPDGPIYSPMPNNALSGLEADGERGAPDSSPAFGESSDNALQLAEPTLDDNFNVDIMDDPDWHADPFNVRPDVADDLEFWQITDDNEHVWEDAQNTLTEAAYEHDSGGATAFQTSQNTVRDTVKGDAELSAGQTVYNTLNTALQQGGQQAGQGMADALADRYEGHHHGSSSSGGSSSGTGGEAPVVGATASTGEPQASGGGESHHSHASGGEGGHSHSGGGYTARCPYCQQIIRANADGSWSHTCPATGQNYGNGGVSKPPPKPSSPPASDLVRCPKCGRMVPKSTIHWCSKCNMYHCFGN